MKKPPFSSIIAEAWQPILLTITGILGVGFVLLYRMAEILPSFVQEEFVILSRSLNGVLSDPLFLHQQIIQKLTFLVTNNELLSVRLPSVIVAITAVFGFYLVISLWFTRRIAIFTSFLLIFSSWFLHIGRLGTTDAAYLLPMCCLAAAAWLHARRKVAVSSLGLIVFGMTLLYIPGMIWFVVPILIWQRKIVLQTLRKLHRWQIIVLSSLIIVGLLPLIIALGRNPMYILRVAAVPDNIAALQAAPNAALQTVSDIFLRRTENPLYGIAKLPHLSILLTTMVSLGLFAVVYNRRLDRFKLLIVLLASGLFFSSVSSEFSEVFLITPLFLLAGGGIALLLQQWFTVFPKNPFARSIGIVLVVSAIAMNSLLGATRYFIAWPHTPDTAEIFTSNEN